MILETMRISNENRLRIATLKEAGHSWRYIFQQLRDVYGCGATSRAIRMAYSRYTRTGTVGDAPGRGRPIKLCERDERQLVLMAKRNRYYSLREISGSMNNIGIGVSRQTANRTLQKYGLKRRALFWRPLLKHSQRKKRRFWAENHLDWKEELWKNVAFSDEKLFRTDTHKPGFRVTRTDREKFSKGCVLERPKHGIQVHAWGLIGWNGTGPIRRLKGNFNAVRYQNEIVHDIEKVGPALVPQPENFVFQQDRAPPHAARSTLEFLNDKEVSILDWPGSSPDMNPIEHVWAYLSRKLGRRPTPTNELQYWNMIQEEWAQVPVEYVRDLILSMPRRVRALAKAHGGFTAY